MATTTEAIVADINEAVSAGFRSQLIARGQARAMIWRDGKLPANAPDFSPRLSYDLLSYGYSLLGLGLRLNEMDDGDRAVSLVAFEQAAVALEAVVAKGNREAPEQHFHFVMAAASYHLARLSARAYSLLEIIKADSNFSPCERVLALLMQRDLNALHTEVFKDRMSGLGSDEQIASSIESRLDGLDGAIDHAPYAGSLLLDCLIDALTDEFFASIALFLSAVERGERQLVDEALVRLRRSTSICSEMSLVPLWWVHRVAIHLLTDLWSNTLHERLPRFPTGGDASDWSSMRELFVACPLRRSRAEVELWPSQIAAATRVVDQSDDLVVSLPTSAGKTRIAELCILRCLSSGKRVIFVTPLRALSAQTETTLNGTFGPLGKSVSTLYGSIGTSHFDSDSIRKRDIVVATPEKIDFALRNDPSLLDNVGLVVFDEGHMIGIGEREVRYEAQIQRLLKRTDADERRIVCLSAILPDGDQMEDFVAWLRRDKHGEPVKDSWRPTRLRFGEVNWKSPTARLDFRVDEERTWVPKFLEGFVPPKFVAPKRRRRKLFPDNQRELCLATAWQLVDEGQTVLIYCPIRKSVDPYAMAIVDLHERGALRSLLEEDPKSLSTAMALGKEWLGPDSAILKCLELGVALHHGVLPTAYRKEIESLLRKGVLKVTISSPTLAQGLNLSATAIVMHSLYRSGKRIDNSEFKNVSGRAGRAYVDLEGIVLFPMFNKKMKDIKPKERRKEKRRRKNLQREWQELVTDDGSHNLESGLVLLVSELLTRMKERIGGDSSQLMEYVLNNAQAWTFPEFSTETPSKREEMLEKWEQHVATLDTAILSLIGENEIPDDQIETTLDEVLRSSYWHRRLLRKEDCSRQVQEAALFSRSKFIWSRSTTKQRRGYFLAGVGLSAGKKLDAMSVETNSLLASANVALRDGNAELAIGAITRLAERVFAFHPFAPSFKPDGWQDLLCHWLLGEPLPKVARGQESNLFRFVEDGFVYRLPWAMEAVRVRAAASGDVIAGEGLEITDHDLGLAVPAVETGTMCRSASLLIQAGFTSRSNAIKAVSDTGASFTSEGALETWLNSDKMSYWNTLPEWPSAGTKSMWMRLVQSFERNEHQTWTKCRYRRDVAWTGDPPPPGTPINIYQEKDKSLVLAADGVPLGVLKTTLNPDFTGLCRATVSDEAGVLDLVYLGPNDLGLE